MAYNIFYNNKRKTNDVKQTNSSARILPVTEETKSELQRLPSKTDIERARRTGELSLVNFYLTEIPYEIYCINIANSRRKGYNSFDSVDDVSWWEDVLLSKLDVSFNKIRSIDSNIKLLNNLSFLDLHNNNIELLPEEMIEMDNLTYLDISHNRISVLPGAIGSLYRLKTLLMGANKIYSLPREFCRLTSLEILDISHNEMVNIPEIIGYFIKLQKLYLSNNGIKILPDVIAKLKGLTVLDVSKNKLIAFPIDFEAKFEILKLNVNKLIEFPIFRYTPSLKELYISYNKIIDFTVEHVSFIPNIEILIMSSNKVSDLPDEVAQFRSICHLDISSNNLNSIPYDLGFVQGLQHLNVEGNPIRSIKRSAIIGGTDALKLYLRTRSCHTPDSTQIPETEIPNVEAQNNSNISNDSFKMDFHDTYSNGTVDLSNRGLENIPENCFIFLKSKNVKHFQFSYNKLTEIPRSIFWFANTLLSLDVSYNQIMELPDSFNNLKCLEHLNLSGNYLRDLPKSFINMKDRLLTLNLAHNPIGISIPSVIFQLTSLQELNVSNCSIANVNCEEFIKLKVLSKLDISNNEIETLPPLLDLCQNIKTIILHGNKFSDPSPHTMDCDNDSAFKYQRSQI